MVLDDRRLKIVWFTGPNAPTNFATEELNLEDETDADETSSHEEEEGVGGGGRGRGRGRNGLRLLDFPMM